MKTIKIIIMLFIVLIPMGLNFATFLPIINAKSAGSLFFFWTIAIVVIIFAGTVFLAKLFGDWFDSKLR